MATDTQPRTRGTAVAVPRTPGRPGGLGGTGSPPKRGVTGGLAPGGSRVTSPRHTRPVTRPATGTRPATARPRPAIPRSRGRTPRMPFILLLVGLLGGALVSLLVISTTLAQGSYQITSLQQQNASLSRQEQDLTAEVAQAADPATIAREAEQYGMQQDPDLRFIDTKTGKVVSGKVTSSEEEINVPGYTP